MKEKRFIFCHGWGFDATFWAPLTPYFLNEQTVYLDLGYFGQQSCPLVLDPSVEWIGVGHSWGLRTLMALPIPFSCLIGLNGFTHFLGHDALLHDRRHREWMSLMRHFKRDPYNTLMQFYQRAGVACKRLEKTQINRTKLQNDLESLISTTTLSSCTQMLILGSHDDVVVPPELIEDNFCHQPFVHVAWCPQAKHGLGHLSPAWVHQQTVNFLHVAR